MKSKIKHTCLLLLTVFVSLCKGQDIITLKNGDEVKAKVIEIERTAVKYKKFDNLNGPIYSFLKTEVFMIHYENGTKDIITSTTPVPASTPEQKPVPAQSNNQPKPQTNYTNSKNSHYKREIIGGAVMTGLGIPLTITGVTLVGIGGAISETATSYNDYDGSDLWITGAVLLASGTALTIAGPIQLSKGIKHRREFKYGRAFIDFQPIRDKYFDTHFRAVNYQRLGAITLHF